MKLLVLATRQSPRDLAFLIICIVAGVATAIPISAFPIYSDAVQRLAVKSLADSAPPSATGAWVHARDVAFNPGAIQAATDALDATAEPLGDLYAGKTLFARSGILEARIVGQQRPPIPGGWHYQSASVNDLPFRYVTGRPPREKPEDDIEVAMAANAAQRLSIATGDQIRLTVPPTDIVHSVATVTGTFEPIDQAGEFWQGVYASVMDPQRGASGGPPPVIALTNHPTLIDLASDALADLGEIWAVYYTDLDELKRLDINQSIDALDGFSSQVSRDVPSSLSVAGIRSGLLTLRRQLAFANVSTRIAGSLFVAFLGFGLLALARILSSSRDADRAGLEARGADRKQVTQTFLIHGALITLIPVIVGPLVSSALVPQLGRTSAFGQLSGGEPWAWSMTIEQFAYALIVSLAVAAYFMAPAIATRVGPLLTAAARPVVQYRPWIWRANLDVMLAVAALALIYETSSRGALVGADGILSLAQTLLPVAAATVVALAALRGMRLIGALFALFGRSRFAPNVAVTARLFARSVMTHSTPMLIAAGAVVVAIISSGLQATLTANTADRAAYAAAADIRITNLDGYQGELSADVEQLKQLDWIRHTAWGVRAQGQAGTTEQAPEFELLAVQPERFADVSWFRDDFARESLTDLMAAITPHSLPESLAIADHAAELVISADIAYAGTGRIDLWARISDPTGRTHTLQMERRSTDRASGSTATYRSPIPGQFPRPLTLLGIQVYEPPVSELATPLQLQLELIGTVPEPGIDTPIDVISDFDDHSIWHAMASSLPDNAQIVAARSGRTELAADDGNAVQVTFGRGSDDGIRGIYRSTSGQVEVPLLVNEAFLDQTGLQPGDQFTGNALGRFVPFVVRGRYDLFPTFRSGDTPNAVANVSALRGYIAPVSEPFLQSNAELFAKLNPGGTAEPREADVKAVNPALTLVDRAGSIAESATSLASVAGWRSISGTVTAVATGVGVLTLLAFSTRFVELERRNNALMRALGTSTLTTKLNTAIRLGIPVLIGTVVVGLAGGIYGIAWFAQNMTRADDGANALPPLQLAIDWIPIAVVATVICISAVLPAFFETLLTRSTSLASQLRSVAAR